MPLSTLPPSPLSMPHVKMDPRIATFLDVLAAGSAGRFAVHAKPQDDKTTGATFSRFAFSHMACFSCGGCSRREILKPSIVKAIGIRIMVVLLSCNPASASKAG